MSAVFKKLNLKDQKEILVINSPESFEPELASLGGVTIRRSTDSVDKAEFSLAFVSEQNELDNIAKAIAQNTQGDAIVWFAYPKASSKRFRCKINRDTGWAILGELGFESVRQVAIDEDWSAVRFRRVEFMKKMVRDKKWAMTEKGKKKAGK